MDDERVDFSDEETLRNPYPGYEKLRNAGPVSWNEFEQAWLVLGHSEARRLARDGRLSAQADRTPIVAALPDSLADAAYRLKNHFESWMLFSDDPRHTLLRSQIAPSLTAENVESYREDLRRRARELLTQAGAECDVMTEYAIPLARLNLAQVFGVPEDRLMDAPGWAHEIVEFINIDFVQKQAVEEQAVKTARVIAEMADFVDELRLLRPTAGSVGAALGIALDAGHFDRLDAEGVVGQMVSGVLAAQPYLIGNLAVALWKERPEPVPDYEVTDIVEEILRYDPSFLIVPRTAIEDIDVGGATIRAGDRVGILLGAVNRDTHAFDCPHAFDPARDRKSHMSFGNGAHYCLGANLVRLFTEVAGGELLAAFPPATTSVRYGRHAPYFGTRVPRQIWLHRDGGTP